MTYLWQNTVIVQRTTEENLYACKRLTKRMLNLWFLMFKKIGSITEEEFNSVKEAERLFRTRMIEFGRNNYRSFLIESLPTNLKNLADIPCMLEKQDQMGLLVRIYPHSRRTPNRRKLKIPNFQIRCNY